MERYALTYYVLQRCYSEPPSTKSNFARENTNELAYAASLGLITVIVPRKGHTNKWHLTQYGLKTLINLDLKETYNVA